MVSKIFFKERHVGYLDGSVYISHRKVKLHYYIKGRGYPITNSVLHYIKSLGAKTIRIVAEGAKGTTIYECPIEKYLNAVLIQEPNFEQQRCIPISDMNIINKALKNKKKTVFDY